MFFYYITFRQTNAHGSGRFTDSEAGFQEATDKLHRGNQHMVRCVYERLVPQLRKLTVNLSRYTKLLGKHGYVRIHLSRINFFREEILS
jgi:hypothetical protein